MGDYNTTFNDLERLDTNRTKGEINIANRIKFMMEELQLRDCWEGVNDNSMTWRHGTKMSRLDRIQWSRDLELKVIKTESDWSYTQSDHCEVVTKLGQQKRTN